MYNRNMNKSYKEIVERIEELSSQADTIQAVSKLRDLLPQIQEQIIYLRELLSIEEEQSVRQEIHDSLYDLRVLTRDINFKMNKIAKAKIAKPKWA